MTRRARHSDGRSSPPRREDAPRPAGARDEALRARIQASVERLGLGFSKHPGSTDLRDALRSGSLDVQDYYRQLLRLAYRLFFRLVAEDRRHRPPTPAGPRLRELARDHHGSPDRSLWRQLRPTPGADDPELPAPELDRAELADADLLAALDALAHAADEHRRREYALVADELGGVYEALLELRPRLNLETGEFTLVRAPGNARKTSGSYYTPPALIESLLDSALMPVLDAATLDKPRDAAIAALLDLKICDPACGSGRFLIAAARRLARRLAALRSGADEPDPKAIREAARDVALRCLFGVDIDPVAIELCRMAIWIEAIDPDTPLTALTSQIQCGDALLGVTPALLARGLPEGAFSTASAGDDRETASALRRRDRDERRRPMAPASLGPLRPALDRLAAASPATLELLADLWCAALVWPTTPELLDAAPTTARWLHLIDRPDALSPATRHALAGLKRQYPFFHWHLRFPRVFAPAEQSTYPGDPCGWTGGFDVVLGNPPWERVKLQEKEFFTERAPALAAAGTAAQRRTLLAELPQTQPALWSSWLATARASGDRSRIYRASGRFPLCGRGDVNTYSLFAELNLQLLSPRGRAGFIVPTGLATDATTSPYIAHLVDRAALASLVSYENFGTTFTAVNNRQSFCLITLSAAPVADMRFQFNVNQPARAADATSTAYTLKPADLHLLSPNTRTCPTFRSQRDADIVRAIYHRVPVLWRENAPDGNPWRLAFKRMLDMAGDSGLFRTRDDLERAGWTLRGSTFTRGDATMLPLYEAKMVQQFDHRFATLISSDPGDRPSRKFAGWYGLDPADPHACVMPRYWVDSAEVTRLTRDFPPAWRRGWFLGFRDITRSTDARTLIASVVPHAAIGHTLPLLLTGDEFAPLAGDLLASLLSVALDYVARQRLGGAHLTYSYLKQLPVFPPQTYRQPVAWDPRIATLSDWLRPRVLELVYTAWDLEPFARDLGHHGPPFRWDDRRRLLLRAELDAAFFHLYGIPRADIAWILDSFWVVRQRDHKLHGEYRTRRLILDRHDAIAHARTSGVPYETPLDPPPAHASLTHPPRLKHVNSSGNGSRDM